VSAGGGGAGGTATARARANVALVKYWGKRDARLNLPAAGSLSLTVDGLATTTTVRFDPHLRADDVLLEGRPAADAFAARVTGFLDLVRERAGHALRARVQTANGFPTGAGLASSASGFAALAAAATRAAGLDLPEAALSALARRGSGSAARSIFGGLVLMHAGSREDGEDACAEGLLAPADWADLRLVVAVTARGPKALSSGDGMRRTVATSRLYPAFTQGVARDLEEARAAVAARDLARLGEVAERSALEMHASALAARPPAVYVSGATLDGLAAVVELRREGVPAWFTCDAGPQPKALTDAAHADAVAARLRDAARALEVLVCRPGRGVELLA
jgi:diphosphomevalonate decarboxylase